MELTQNLIHSEFTRLVIKAQNCKAQAKTLTTKAKASQKCQDQGQGLTKNSRPRSFTQRPRHFGQGHVSLMMDITNVVLHAKLSVQLMARQIFKQKHLM